MFRRFMIVCWVLCGLLALIATAGWIIGFEADRQHEVVLAEAQSLFEKDTDFASLRKADRLSDGQITEGDLTEGELEAIAVAKAQEVERHAAKERLVEINNKIEMLAMTAVYGSFGVGAMLLWNIFCHTGHWIWTGRKEQ